MDKSFADYPTLPRIDTAGIDDEDVIDRAREKQRFRKMYKDMIPDQKRIIKELIRVGVQQAVSVVPQAEL
jgi:hypothetical protein